MLQDPFGLLAQRMYDTYPGTVQRRRRRGRECAATDSVDRVEAAAVHQLVGIGRHGRVPPQVLLVLPLYEQYQIVVAVAIAAVAIAAGLIRYRVLLTGARRLDGRTTAVPVLPVLVPESQ